jgi:N-acetyl sugar amidotransferase
MDGSDPDLEIDAEGVCHHCRAYDRAARSDLFDPAKRDQLRARLVERIIRRGRGRPYDCVLGLSGGADSSYAAYIAKQVGLRPLAIHVDNGWNSELAVMNIESVVEKLGIDLVTHVIDWQQFRALQLSLIKASVVDLELISDHAIIAGMYHTARRFRVPFILSGDNAATEATLPRTWNHRKTDLMNIRSIHRRHVGGSLSSFPKLGTLGMFAHQVALRIEYLPFLSYFPYHKQQAIETMQRELGWRPYGSKHYESIITRFYQGYILPRKFGIDKRRFHFSRLILSGQMTREAAVAALATPPYDPDMLASDREFFLKKLGLSESEFEAIMKAPPRSHYEYGSDRTLVESLLRLNRFIRASLRLLQPRPAG